MPAQMPTGGIETLIAGNMLCQQGSAITTTDEFAEALRSIGRVVSGTHPILDGNKHRISVEGERHCEHSRSGFYVATWTGTRPAT